MKIEDLTNPLVPDELRSLSFVTVTNFISFDISRMRKNEIYHFNLIPQMQITSTLVLDSSTLQNSTSNFIIQLGGNDAVEKNNI